MGVGQGAGGYHHDESLERDGSERCLDPYLSFWMESEKIWEG